jgi:hypothetical protein
MRRIFSRSLLDHLAGDNPRARAEFERLDSLLSDVNDKGQTVGDQLDGLLSDLGEGGKFQRATAILEAIANLPDRVGSIEIASDGQAVIRPIDGQDPASLMSRGVAYTLLVGIAGKGTTAQRPILPAKAVAIYFDTTLAANGKPIFWNGAIWVDSAGAAV